MTTVSTEQLQKICENPNTKAYLSFISGNPQIGARRAADPGFETDLNQCLCFANSFELAQKALQANVAILIIDRKVDVSKLTIPASVSCFVTPSITAAMALILPFFDTKKLRFEKGIHPTAVIAPSAKIATDAHIGAYVVIGDNAQIAQGCCIGAHTVIESDAVIGANCILHPHVFIGSRCVLGNHCEIHPHTTIGSDGFGFIKDPQGVQQKIPQLGIVVLEDHVEMGANCAVDRATLSETRIGEGSKFDNLCHIAHNCKIGKRNVFAGGFMVAGSSTIGDDCMFGGGTLVADHVTVGNKVIVGGKAAVTKDVLEPGAYTGYPLQPLKEGLRNIANIANLTEIRKDVAAIKEKLSL